MKGTVWGTVCLVVDYLNEISGRADIFACGLLRGEGPAAWISGAKEHGGRGGENVQRSVADDPSLWSWGSVVLFPPSGRTREAPLTQGS